MTVHLICEGPSCNPNVPAYDEEVLKALRMTQGRCGIGGVISRWGVELFKTLHHTPHQHVGQNVYGCAACGHTRRWGNAV